MGLQLRHLDDDPRTRQYMRSEVDADIEAGTLYYGKFLASAGEAAWPGLLRESVSAHDDDWLAVQMNTPGYHLERYEKNTPSGGRTTAAVPYTGPQMLAEGEFNRFHVRGLCLRALDDGIDELRIVRVKEVEKPRSASEQLRGTLVRTASCLPICEATRVSTPLSAFRRVGTRD